MRDGTERGARVAIIGGGVAAAAAARELTAAHVSVCLFDKARGLGGRASTRRHDDLRFDHGAQYFTARAPALIQQVDDWIARSVAARWTARIGVAANGAVTDKATNPTRFVGTPGMSALVADLARGVRVERGVHVDRLERERGWFVVSTGRRWGPFEHVIVTAPAEQAVRLVRASKALLQHAASIQLAPTWAVMCAFDRPVPIDHDGIFVQGAPVAWAARNSSKPGRPPGEAWVLHASHTWSRAHLEDAPEAVTQALLTSFAESTGAAVPSPHFAQAHRWSLALAQQPGELPFASDAELGLSIAGDWCADGRIEGAYLSGRAAARALLA